MTGYDTHDRFYATRYKQGVRTVYNIDLSLMQIDNYLPIPDPDRPTEGNRRVKETHARDFGSYLRSQAEWVAPALLLRAPDIFTFETKEEIAGTQFGVLSLPRVARMELKILDGQHRILGIHYALEDMSKDIANHRALLSQARREENPPLISHYEDLIDKLERQRQRFDHERISLQIHIEDDPDAYKQMFVDVADNALGISSAIRARFDNRRIVNRCLDSVLKHGLLRDRVDLEQDRISPRSQYLMGAKHVVDIIRTIAVGIDGRIGPRRESELDEARLVQETNEFLDLIADSFGELARVADDELSVETLRKSSLLGSVQMLRILAGVYHQLLEKEWELDEIREFFERLAPEMAAPVTKGSKIFATGNFVDGAVAPNSRTQDLRNLVRTLTKWAVDREL